MISASSGKALLRLVVAVCLDLQAKWVVMYTHIAQGSTIYRICSGSVFRLAG